MQYFSIYLNPQFQKPGVCQSSYRSPVLVHFEHQGCYSARSYRPLFCGMCSDGRCCSPDRTRTALVTFRCPRGRLAQHAVMMIESCVCHYDCPHPNSSRRTRSWLQTLTFSSFGHHYQIYIIILMLSKVCVSIHQLCQQDLYANLIRIVCLPGADVDAEVIKGKLNLKRKMYSINQP